MRVAIFGDIHGWFEPTQQPTIEYFQDVVASLECDLMLQVGDMCHYRALARPGYELGDRIVAEAEPLWPTDGCCTTI